MRNSLCLFLAWLLTLSGMPAQEQPKPPAAFQNALPGYQYQFPRDNFNHPEYQTEWWYYTGNLRAKDGHRFGFELTFFRHSLKPGLATASDWDPKDVYMAHLALSDPDSGRFYHEERIHRSGPGLAGVDALAGKIWNGNWSILWKGSEQTLSAIGETFSLKMHFNSAKPPVIHGVKGVSQKSAGVGEASHYISYTRLLTSGTLSLGGREYRVEGSSWMDHEFFTGFLGKDQVGWDWMCLQFTDNTELMLYRFRRKDGSADPFSSATYVDGQGTARHLSGNEFQMQPTGERWTSPATHASYPVAWQVAVPALGLSLSIRTPLKSQELSSRYSASQTYWEGAIDAEGVVRGGQPLKGVGYLEMTGYVGPMSLQSR